jgi:DNA-binding PadR family transcriptional regulator
MDDPLVLELTLPDWLVLCLAAEQPIHGFALAGLLSPRGSIGRIWLVHKSKVYRALPLLESLGLMRTVGAEPSSGGPVRSLYEVTAAGRTAARQWLHQPVKHGRDVRSELLPKLALLDRAGADPTELLSAQLTELHPIAAALEDQAWATSGFDRVLILWRRSQIEATMRFLQEELTTRRETRPALTQIAQPGA